MFYSIGVKHRGIKYFKNVQNKDEISPDVLIQFWIL